MRHRRRRPVTCRTRVTSQTPGPRRPSRAPTTLPSGVLLEKDRRKTSTWGRTRAGPTTGPVGPCRTSFDISTSSPYPSTRTVPTFSGRRTRRISDSGTRRNVRGTDGRKRRQEPGASFEILRNHSSSRNLLESGTPLVGLFTGPDHTPSKRNFLQDNSSSGLQSSFFLVLLG